jgi:hypothetical protein
MADGEYSLTYDQIEDVRFPSKRGVQRHLREESALWAPVLDYVRQKLSQPLIIRNGQETITAKELADALNTLEILLDDRSQFNAATNRLTRNMIRPPPPSSTLVGELILGLFEIDLKQQSLAVYVNFMVNETKVQYREGDQLHQLVKIGKPLMDAAPIVKALPYHRTTTAKMTGTVRAAQSHVESLSSEVANAMAANERHFANLNAHLEDQKQHAKRANDVILRLNRRQDKRHKNWMEATDQLVQTAFEDARKKVRFFELNSKKAEEARIKEFERLQLLFSAQLRLRAPVKLWEEREKKHSSNSASSMTMFLIVGFFAMAFGLGVPFVFGDYIADSFYQQFCGTVATASAMAQNCERIFSAKGPVTITGLVFVMSLLMWMARLQYRIHLSERHLALDASERKAFAETYLAMKEGSDVGKDNEAIVLASLFRPTQDGIIRDDETGMDLSAITLLAKQFGRSS